MNFSRPAPGPLSQTNAPPPEILGRADRLLFDQAAAGPHTGQAKARVSNLIFWWWMTTRRTVRTRCSAAACLSGRDIWFPSAENVTLCAGNGPGHLRYDLVLLDIMMPEIDGYQVLSQMKADPALCDIPGSS